MSESSSSNQANDMFDEHMDLLEEIFEQLHEENKESGDGSVCINYKQFRELLEVHCYLVFNSDAEFNEYCLTLDPESTNLISFEKFKEMMQKEGEDEESGSQSSSSGAEEHPEDGNLRESVSPFGLAVDIPFERENSQQCTITAETLTLFKLLFSNNMKPIENAKAGGPKFHMDVNEVRREVVMHQNNHQNSGHKNLSIREFEFFFENCLDHYVNDIQFSQMVSNIEDKLMYSRVISVNHSRNPSPRANHSLSEFYKGSFAAGDVDAFISRTNYKDRKLQKMASEEVHVPKKISNASIENLRKTAGKRLKQQNAN